MSEDLQFWEEIRDAREEDLALEMLRDEDPYLINLLMSSLTEAKLNIEQLTDV